MATHILDIDYEELRMYPGNYDQFLESKAQNVVHKQKEIASLERKSAEMQAFVERFRYKATKARQVQSRVKALEKLDRIVIDQPGDPRARFGFPTPRRSSRIVAEFDGVTAGYDDGDGKVVLSDVSFTVERGRTIALVGPNGAGKTTLVKLMTDRLAPLSGQVTIGQDARIAVLNTVANHVPGGDNGRPAGPIFPGDGPGILPFLPDGSGRPRLRADAVKSILEKLPHAFHGDRTRVVRGVRGGDLGGLVQTLRNMVNAVHLGRASDHAAVGRHQADRARSKNSHALTRRTPASSANAAE